MKLKIAVHKHAPPFSISLPYLSWVDTCCSCKTHLNITIKDI
jgi:hypothetical protein